ncbi:hypothetical protein DVH24_004732 [Malus domestica]|uniref:Uncharacterized protein n=1 Tax=Malus domestica TaxID=3750 RepID=A0A498IAN8_MALDO|nr:hypothetical protein DVH24_004732 [Malus domestica]
MNNEKAEFARNIDVVGRQSVLPHQKLTSTFQMLANGARCSCRHTSGQGLALIPNCHIPTQAPTTSQALLRRSTILSALGLDHALMNSHEKFLVGHPLWECSRPNSLNFGVPTEPEASELLKGLMLGRGWNIHIRLKRSTPLGDVGCYTVCSILVTRTKKWHICVHFL